MGFTIPNVADANHATQAEVDSRDLEIILAGFQRTWVVSGGLVSAQGTPNMTVAISAASVRINGTLVASAGSASLAIGAAHATLARFDLITCDTSGVFAVVAGTAAAVPVYPAIPANRCVHAAVRVPAAAASIVAANITDKRVIGAITIDEVGNPPVPGTGLSKIVELTGTVDGANKVFTVPEEYQQGSLKPLIGGIAVRPGYYTLSGVGNKTVTFGASVPAPVVGEWVGGMYTV